MNYGDRFDDAVVKLDAQLGGKKVKTDDDWTWVAAAETAGDCYQLQVKKLGTKLAAPS